MGASEDAAQDQAIETPSQPGAWPFSGWRLPWAAISDGKHAALENSQSIDAETAEYRSPASPPPNEAEADEVSVGTAREEAECSSKRPNFLPAAPSEAASSTPADLEAEEKATE